MSHHSNNHHYDSLFALSSCQQSYPRAGHHIFQLKLILIYILGKRVLCYSYVIFAIHLENILFLNVLLPGCNQNSL